MFEDIMFWIFVAIFVIAAMVLILPGIASIGDSEVGIVTRKNFGNKLPEGRIVAVNGEIGIQTDTLMPGLYYRFPIFWQIEKVPVVAIAPGNVGVVTSIDGAPLDQGRYLGNEVECSNFQNASDFIKNGGKKGLQISILKPGEYRINTKVFTVKAAPAVNIPQDKVGIVISLDGIPLPSNMLIAPDTDTNANHQHFQNAQAFIDAHGYRGTQLETLQPGQYYMNPFLFRVDTVSVATVPAGYVGVIVSSVGTDVETYDQNAPSPSTTPDLSQPPVTPREIPLITDKRQRGILKDPVMPGKYNLNTIAYRPELVPTSAVTIKWSTEEVQGDSKVSGIDNYKDSEKATEFYKYSQLVAVSKDGFQLGVDMKIIARIRPESAPYVISRFGSVYNLIEQVIHPLIDSLFRNEAGKSQAMDFLHSREALQNKALETARTEFQKYHVEVQGLLIAFIKVDQALLDTQTKRELAFQQQTQYEQEAKAQDSRIAVQEKTARADKQKDVIAAELGIIIAENEAKALVKKAEGTKAATILESEGDSQQIVNIGNAQAGAYKAQAEVIGNDNVAMLKGLQTIGDSKTVITPEIYVSGSNGESGGSMFQTYLATLMKKDKVASAKSE